MQRNMTEDEIKKDVISRCRIVTDGIRYKIQWLKRWTFIWKYEKWIDVYNWYGSGKYTNVILYARVKGVTYITYKEAEHALNNFINEKVAEKINWKVVTK